MANDTPTCPECGAELDDETLTKSAKERWEYTGTVLALFVVLSLPLVVVLTGLSIFTLSPISQAWWALYATVVLMAATWTFGRETLKAVKEARS